MISYTIQAAFRISIIAKCDPVCMSEKSIYHGRHVSRPAKNIVSKGSFNEINLRIIFFIRTAPRRLRNWIKRPSWKFLHVDTEFIPWLVSNITKHVKFRMRLLNYDDESFFHDRFFVLFFWVNEKIVENCGTIYFLIFPFFNFMLAKWTINFSFNIREDYHSSIYNYNTLIIIFQKKCER